VSAIQRINARGFLLAGVRYDAPLFGNRDDTGQPIGFEIDLMHGLAKQLLGDPDKVEFVQVTSSDRITKLLNGEVDIIAATMTHTKEREEQIDFSQTYFLDGQNILVKRNMTNTESITDIAGLRGKKIAVVTGATSLAQIEDFARVHGLGHEANGEFVLDIEIKNYNTYSQAIQPLRNGDVDALTTDLGILLGIAQQYPNELTVLLAENFTQEPYGLGLPPGDSLFANTVNFALQSWFQDMKKTGEYEQLYQKWFATAIVPYPIEVWQGEWYTFDELVTQVEQTPTLGTQPMLDSPTLARINARGFLLAGVRYDAPPFGYRDDNGQLVGFEIDLMHSLAARWLGDPDKVEFVQVISSDRITKLLNGEVDIIAATMTHNWDRDQKIEFSQTYFLDGQNILVKRNMTNTESITDIAGLRGKKIAVVTGATSLAQIEDFARVHGLGHEANGEFAPDIEIVERFNTYSAAIQPLLNEEIDALTTDLGILRGIAQQYPNELTVLLAENFTQEPYGLGVPNSDQRFRDLVNFTLQEMKADGTYDVLYKYWFGTEQTPFALEIWPGYYTFDLAPMAYIEKGNFRLGRDDSKYSEYNEGPASIVELDDFYIDQYEVTNRLYLKCVKNKKCTEPSEVKLLAAPSYFYAQSFASHPVVYITWHAAVAYCKSVGKELPTEAQWEKAARGAYTDTMEATNNAPLYIYPWGDSKDKIEQRAAYSTNYEGFPKAVGSYRYEPSGLSPDGVHDMAGNVQEWVQDCYKPRYDDEKCVQSDSRVVRSSGWNEEVGYLTTTRRTSLPPVEANENLGFRCAMEIDPKTRFSEQVQQDEGSQ